MNGGWYVCEWVLIGWLVGDDDGGGGSGGGG